MSSQIGFDFETGTHLVAGVDEVGRGPLAGPVVAAAVILDPARPVEGLADSKKLSEKRREALAEVIQERALAWALGRAEVEEIDHLNILQASLLAMQRAVSALQPQAKALYQATGYGLVREEASEAQTIRTVGSGLVRFYFEKPLG